MLTIWIVHRYQRSYLLLSNPLCHHGSRQEHATYHVRRSQHCAAGRCHYQYLDHGRCRSSQVAFRWRSPHGHIPRYHCCFGRDLFCWLAVPQSTRMDQCCIPTILYACLWSYLGSYPVGYAFRYVFWSFHHVHQASIWHIQKSSLLPFAPRVLLFQLAPTGSTTLSL